MFHAQRDNLPIENMTTAKQKPLHPLNTTSQFWQQYLFGREGNWSSTGLDWRRSVLCGSTGRCLWWWLTCGINNGGCLGGFVFRDALQIESNSKIRLSVKNIHTSPLSYLETASPCSECEWGTERPGLSWGTPARVSAGRRIRAPPPPGRECYERRRPTTAG